MAMRFETLHEWLDWQSGLHPKSIDLGLARPMEVAGRLGQLRSPPRVVTVAGTNGKGSTVSTLEAILRSGGYRVGSYLSPHLLRYNERIRIDGQEVTDAVLVNAFAEVDEARHDTSLTFFEFGTLAAMQVFSRCGLDFLLLEVGLGGRLDVVNIYEPEVTVLTSIGIDHTEWLGDTREDIGREKAGIFRQHVPVVIADRQPPRSVMQKAAELKAPVHLIGQHFDPEISADRWDWIAGEVRIGNIPCPRLCGRHQVDNASAAIMASRLLDASLSPEVVRTGVGNTRLAGRYQQLLSEPNVIIDVAHNREAVESLASILDDQPVTGRTVAVFAMYQDKDIESSVEPLATLVDQWYIAGLSGPRGQSAAEIKQRLSVLPRASAVEVHDNVVEAYLAAKAALSTEDRLVAFGSFTTAAAVLELACPDD